MSNHSDTENTDQAKLEEISSEKRGKPSEFACPECHGVLWENDDEGLLRFRCRVGHAYTADALRVEMSESSENALWAAMRALEEKTSLWRRMASRSGDRLAAHYSEEADQFEKHVEEIRRILLDTNIQQERGSAKTP